LVAEVQRTRRNSVNTDDQADPTLLAEEENRDGEEQHGGPGSDDDGDDDNDNEDDDQNETQTKGLLGKPISEILDQHLS
jgi:hypothetical protein